MQIKWNEVTWYSKLLAFIFFVSSLLIGFYFGEEYQDLKTSLDKSSNSIKPETVITAPHKITNTPFGSFILPIGWEMGKLEFPQEMNSYYRIGNIKESLSPDQARIWWQGIGHNPQQPIDVGEIYIDRQTLYAPFSKTYKSIEEFAKSDSLRLPILNVGPIVISRPMKIDDRLAVTYLLSDAVDQYMTFIEPLPSSTTVISISLRLSRDAPNYGNILKNYYQLMESYKFE